MQPKPKVVSESLKSGKETKWKDETMYSEAIIAYRDQFNLTPNFGFRKDICVTIKTYDDLCIWTSLLAAWGYVDKKTGKWKARNPLDVKGLLTCFEFKKREKENGKMATSNTGNDKASPVSARRRKGISSRRDSEVHQVRVQPPSDYFRVD